jgi:hypothetical protein
MRTAGRCENPTAQQKSLGRDIPGRGLETKVTLLKVVVQRDSNRLKLTLDQTITNTNLETHRLEPTFKTCKRTIED